MSSQGTIFIAFYCCILLPVCLTEESPCSCALKGRVYNLAPLASSDSHPRYQTDVKGWNFAYNPCIPFTIKVPECQDVAICRWDNSGKTYTALGLQKDITCELEQDTEEIMFQVPNNPSYKSWVRLKCNPKLTGLHDGRFSVIDGNPKHTILEIEHNCCCPDGCPFGKPLPTEKTPVDIVKWIAVGISGLFGVCIVVVVITVVVYWYCCRRPRRDRNEDGGAILEQGPADRAREH